MGDLPRIKEVTRAISDKLGQVTQSANAQERETKSLEGSLLKAKAKTEEIVRYLKAREDPNLARLVRVRQLGPEQQETQRRLRQSSQSVTEAVEALEAGIANLRERMVERKLGRTPMKAPSLDTIHRASRNITSALHARNVELDDLMLRLEMALLSTTTTTNTRQHASPSAASRHGASASRQYDRSLSESASNLDSTLMLEGASPGRDQPAADGQVLQSKGKHTGTSSSATRAKVQKMLAADKLRRELMAKAQVA